MMDSLVSIIIPVYNAEMYVKRCLDSVTNQTYRNLEIIVVDDGSLDQSGRICEECAAQDSRIRLIHKVNEGSGYARNAGINIAKGEYLFLADSDDYLVDNCIERLVNVARQEAADLVQCDFIQGSEENYTKRPNRGRISIYDNVSAFRTRKTRVTCWGKLYRRETIGDMRCPKVTAFEDEFFTYKFIYNAPKVVILDEAYYYYFMSPISIMRGNKKRQPLQFIQAYEERIAFFEEKKEPELSGISHKELAIRLMLAFIRRSNYKESEMTEADMLRRFKEEYSIGREYARGVKEKLSLFVFNLAPYFMKNSLNIFLKK
ncbi:glycosyltransferase family 2 protein [Oribacterium sinus]|uniref:glycosyltransferase family 2 protein n=1 Tax=Oribacterium sinus TaxID=237576 RepID=UPI0028D4B96C|nr:glycosyltransferase family 2 protein [Oribacterium sinus]